MGDVLGLVCVMFYLHSNQQIALVAGTTDVTNIMLYVGILLVKAYCSALYTV